MVQDATQIYDHASGQSEEWELLSLLIIENSTSETFLKEFSKLLDSSQTVSDS